MRDVQPKETHPPILKDIVCLRAALNSLLDGVRGELVEQGLGPTLLQGRDS